MVDKFSSEERSRIWGQSALSQNWRIVFLNNFGKGESGSEKIHETYLVLPTFPLINIKLSSS